MKGPFECIRWVHSQVADAESPDDMASMVRWCERIETFGMVQVARKGWTFERARALSNLVRNLYSEWRDEWVTWVVETPQPDGTVITRQVLAPTYELALQFVG